MDPLEERTSESRRSIYSAAVSNSILSQSELWMTAKNVIEDFLRRNADESYCDDCLSSNLSIRPRQQVQQKTSSLAAMPFFERRLGPCSCCHRDKLVICFKKRRNATESRARELGPADQDEEVYASLPHSGIAALTLAIAILDRLIMQGALKEEDRVPIFDDAIGSCNTNAQLRPSADLLEIAKTLTTSEESSKVA
jgi:hypothetical protein